MIEIEFERTVTIPARCRKCGEPQEILVRHRDLERWNDGDLIQDCFSYLTADEREILISGICGSCFDKMFDFS